MNIMLLEYDNRMLIIISDTVAYARVAVPGFYRMFCLVVQVLSSYAVTAQDHQYAPEETICKL